MDSVLLEVTGEMYAFETKVGWIARRLIWSYPWINPSIIVMTQGGTSRWQNSDCHLLRK